MDAREEEKAVTEVARRLCERYPTVPAEEIRKLVDDYHREFDGRPIRNFVPVLVEREAREYLAGTIPTQR